jgi:phage gp16-like protein
MPPSKADYAKINIACKELGLDKYELIGDRYGLESTKQLGIRQLADLYAHFRSLGWKVKAGKGREGKISPKYGSAVQRKVVALWITLSKAGVVRNGSDKALQAYVKRVTGVENLKWCDGGHCYSLIESLKSWAMRENVDVER